MSTNQDLTSSVQKAMESMQEYYEKEIQETNAQIDQTFTKDQAHIIKQLLTLSYNLTMFHEEASFSHLNLSVVVEAFYTELVENLKVIDKAQFEKISEELLNVRIKQLTEFKEKQAAQEEN